MQKWLNALVMILGLTALMVSPTALRAADIPPANLHQEPNIDGSGYHWTAWEPPTSLPADVEVYIIVRGDTLWDLAARFYGDPYLWPQLWERNQYILDAHWIYPGDPLGVGVKVTAVESLATVDLGGDPEEVGGEERIEDALDGVIAQGTAGGQPQPLGTETDIYCSGYVSTTEQQFPFRIIGSEYEALTSSLEIEGRGRLKSIYGIAETLRFGMVTGDIVYLDGGRAAGLYPGSYYTVVEADEPVVHPVTGRRAGRMYRYTGRLRVLSVQEDTAIAEVSHSCDPIVVGAHLLPFEPEPVPLARLGIARAVNLPPPAAQLRGAPVILASQDRIVALGQDHVVFIDRGLQDEVTPGDIFNIYRLHRRDLPPVLVGELAVLSVREESSVARITRSRHTIYVGDRLTLK